MIELGQLLKERRVVLGMDLEDVERRTKIRTRYLEALENGDWSVLPGEVYARGFVRSYAECVGLDGLELLERYIDEPHAEALTNSGQTRVEKPQNREGTPRTRVIDEEPRGQHAQHEEPGDSQSRTDKQPTRTSSDEEGVPYLPPSMWKNNNISTKSKQNLSAKPKLRVRDKRPARVGSIVGQTVAVVAAFAILAGAWYWLAGPHNHGGSSVAANDLTNTSGNVSGDSTGTGNQTGADNAVTTSNTTSSNGAGNAAGASGNSASNTASGQAGPAVVLTPQPFDATNHTLTVLASTSGPLVLNATAQGGKCWISVDADGKAIDPNDFVVPGQAKTFSANNELRIDIGNIPVMSVTVNGQPVSLPNVQHPIWLVIKKH